MPTGYSFNLDGTAIYLTMASLFIAEAMDKPLSLGQQISLLVFMIIASKGAAGVTGAGLATLAGGLQSHRPDLVHGVGFIVGIDRLMSEARALTNFAGNSIATVLIGHWVGELDRPRLDAVLAGDLPFDEASMVDDDEPELPASEPVTAQTSASEAYAREQVGNRSRASGHGRGRASPRASRAGCGTFPAARARSTTRRRLWCGASRPTGLEALLGDEHVVLDAHADAAERSGAIRSSAWK